MRQLRRQGAVLPSRKLLRTCHQIEGIRQSARINTAVLDAVAAQICEGMSLSRVDDIVYQTTRSLGARPAPLHYHGYPYSTCVSVNHQVCHGFPLRDRFLRSGDIVNVDCSTQYRGFYSDASRMFEIGETSPACHALVTTALACVESAVHRIVPFRPIGEMSAAVQKCARAAGFSVVTAYGGHGCGIRFHEDPFIDYGFSAREGMLMIPGMTFTVEPMINMGSPSVREDGWEVYTRDGKPSAQWEVQILVTEGGAEILCR